jgi:CheY-like chemotaxis protein
MAEILQAIATILWPIIVIVLVIVLLAIFRPSLRKIIESAKERKFTIKVGNNELTMEEANKQQQNLITDLQTQVLEIRNLIEHGNEFSSKEDIQSVISRKIKNLHVLWVDDNPKNNSYAVQQLNDMQIVVDLALSTHEGIKRFKQDKYSVIISDLGRRENQHMNYTAGFDLLKEIRIVNPTIPFVVFTTSENVRKYLSQANELGVTLITSSWTEIIRLFFIY